MQAKTKKSYQVPYPETSTLHKELRPELFQLAKTLPKLKSHHSKSSVDKDSVSEKADSSHYLSAKSASKSCDVSLQSIDQDAEKASDDDIYLKSFNGIPPQWHETIKVFNKETKRTKLYFRCRYKGCNSVFRKSCNLRDHFRKHTG